VGADAMQSETVGDMRAVPMGNMGLIVAVALATYGTRIVGFALGQRRLPAIVDRFLGYVPVAMFAALIAPDLGLGGEQWAARLLGVAASALAVWRTRQLWAGLVVGMAVFWIVRAL